MLRGTFGLIFPIPIPPFAVVNVAFPFGLKRLCTSELIVA